MILISKILKIAILPALLVLVAITVNASANPTNDSNEIKKVMDAQQEAWNNGNLEGFMEGYWKSGQLKFVGKNGVIYGWQNVYDRYKKSYTDKEAMGTLAFTIISVEALDSKSFHAVGAPVSKKTAYMVLGKWQISGSVKAAEGYFTLIFKKINGKWVIISDHTS